MPVPRKTIAAIRKGKYNVQAKYPDDHMDRIYRYRDTLGQTLTYLKLHADYYEEWLTRYRQFEKDLVAELKMAKHPKRRKLMERASSGTEDLELIARDFGELVDLVS
jgi:hypothetical protein